MSICIYANIDASIRIWDLTMNEVERYFKGLADNNRLRIINLLMHGELCGCDIQYVLEASQPNVSRHLTSKTPVWLRIEETDTGSITDWRRQTRRNTRA